MKFNINCPCCDASVTAVVAPEEKRTRHSPGYPPVLEEVIGCSCFEYLDHLYRKVWITGKDQAYEPALEQYEQEVFEEIDHHYPLEPAR